MHIEIDYRYLQKLEKYKKYKEESLKVFNSGDTVLYCRDYHKPLLFLNKKEAIYLFKDYIYNNGYKNKEFESKIGDLKSKLDDLNQSFESAERVVKLVCEIKYVGWTIQEIKEEVNKIKSMNLFQRLIYAFKKDRTLFKTVH